MFHTFDFSYKFVAYL